MGELGTIEREHEEFGVGQGENLKVFEKTWGHRVLMGLSVCMFAAGIVLAIYCGLRIGSVKELVELSVNFQLAYAFYCTGLVLGIGMIPPAILGVYAATHPKFAIAAMVAAVVALVLIVAFVVYAISIGGQVFSIVMFSVLFAIVPVLYLASAAKIRHN